MGFDAASFTATPLADETSLLFAHRLLCSSIGGDYLSNGRGHQQSRRVVAERRARRVLPSSPNENGAVAGGDKHRSGQLDSPESQYLANVAQRPRLTSREEYGLAARMKAGDVCARDALIESNLGLVVMLARRYQRPGLPLLDLIAEGNLGLLAAAARFDPELGFRFSTYAKWWVLRAMKVALPKLVGVVRLPANQLRLGTAPLGEDVFDISPAAPEPGPEPEREDQAADDGTPSATFAGSPTPGMPAPLGQPCAAPGPTEEEALNAMCAPEEHEPPEELMTAQRAAKLKLALDTLPERDRDVINRRFALTTDEACTLDDLANDLRVSIERVRQIEKAALQKLQLALCSAGLNADVLI